MWIAMWLACGQEPVEPKVVANKPVEQRIEKTDNKQAEKPVDKPMVQLVKGTLFFAKSPDCVSDCIAEVTRMVAEWSPQVALDALYVGPLKKDGDLRLLACESTGAKITSIEAGLAKVELQGGCRGCGTTSIYDLIVPTLTVFPEISVVHLYDANGKSQIDGPTENSRPACLEP